MVDHLPPAGACLFDAMPFPLLLEKGIHMGTTDNSVAQPLDVYFLK